MCGLCGLFECETHWTDMAEDEARPARQARLRRVALANLVLCQYRLGLSDWQGRSYLLSAPTGATEIVGNLAALWPVAERLVARECDPLDPALITALEQA